MGAAAERRSADELVPEPTYGEQVLGLVWVPLDLLANPLDVHIERLGVADVVVAPDPLDQELTRQEAAGRPQERLEQLELLRRERNRGAPDERFVAVDVHLHRPADEDVAGAGGLC